MWAERLKGQILNPKKEFEEGEGIKLYLLNNVFRLNYDSAELMLEDAEEHEDEIYNEYKKYLPEIHKDDPKKHAYIDKYLAGLGMYYGSIISYYFMAFEGFVNLLYHSFLKEELRDQKLDQRLERLDLDWKILFMPALCNGFKSEPINSESDIFKNFLKLRDYRNQIFHSKIGDSLKSVAIVETGFLYACDLEKSNKGLFPSQKRDLKKEDVLRVKSIVDELIKEILSKMNDKSKKLVDEYIMKGLAVPFWVDETGKIRFGKLREGHDLSGEK